MTDGPTRARPGHTLVRYATARLLVTKGPDRGLSIDTGTRRVRIGTETENDLVLSDDSVSRRHCEMELTEGGVRVRDMGSTNGVMTGPVRIRDAVVPLGTIISLGDTEITLQPLVDVLEREQAATDRFGDLLGASPRMRELFADLEVLAESNVTVLIEGETGTGKDLVAESLHRRSARADGPFVVFDCGAIAPSLVESELFGHERGAFTGAASQRVGVFEQAHGGTLFFDEVGELPKDLQPKLLRVLEKREVRRIGGAQNIAVDVRIVAATNRNLRAEVKRGAFREDLYFRLAGATVTVPPLRERMEDLPLLVEHFLRLEAGSDAPAMAVPRSALDLFLAYQWPGNVRELRNAVRRLLVFPDRPLPTLSAEPTAAPSLPRRAVATPLREARREAGDAFERAYLAEILELAQGNVTRAAALAEVSRQMLQKLLRKHGRPED